MTTTVLNTKTSEVENKIPNTSGLATATVLTTKIREAKNKTPDYSKYITTRDLVNKTNFDNKLTSFDKRFMSNETKHLEV